MGLPNDHTLLVHRRDRDPRTNPTIPMTGDTMLGIALSISGPPRWIHRSANAMHPIRGPETTPFSLLLHRFHSIHLRQKIAAPGRSSRRGAESLSDPPLNLCRLQVIVCLSEEYVGLPQSRSPSPKTASPSYGQGLVGDTLIDFAQAWCSHHGRAWIY